MIILKCLSDKWRSGSLVLILIRDYHELDEENLYEFI